MDDTVFSGTFFAVFDAEASTHARYEALNFTLYGESAIYYRESAVPERHDLGREEQTRAGHEAEKVINKQKKDLEAVHAFFKSVDYEKMKRQFAKLVERLNTWCEINSCTVSLRDVAEIEPVAVPAFTLLYQHLFGASKLSDTFYGTHPQSQILLWTQGKASLEIIYHLLCDEHISIVVKKAVIRELQNQIQLCVPGLITYLGIAQSELDTGINIQQMLLKAKENLTIEIISSHLQTAYKHLLGGNQIHYVNAYRNCIAEMFGIPKVKGDYFVDAIKPTPGDIDYFKFVFWEKATPSAVIYHLYTLFQKTFEQQRIQIQHEWRRRFQEKHAVTVEAYCKSDIEAACHIKDGTQTDRKIISMDAYVNAVIDTWNNQYGILCYIDATYLIDLNDDNVTLAEAPSLKLLVSVIRKFTAQFLKEKTIEALEVSSVSNGRDFKTFYLKEGFYWAEEAGTVFPLNVSLFVQYRPSRSEDLQMYFKILGHLVDTDISLEHQVLQESIEKEFVHEPLLLKTLLKTIQAHSSLAIRQMSIFLFLVKKHCISDANLVEGLSYYYNKGEILWQLVKSKQLSLLKILLEKQLLEKEHLNYRSTEGMLKGRTLFWLENKQQTSLIKAAMGQGLLTAADLSTTVPGNISLLWFLVKIGHIKLVHQFLERNLLSPESVGCAPNFGFFKGVNILNLLVHRMSRGKLIKNTQDLLRALITADLVSNENLMGAANDALNGEQGQNVFFLLASNCQYELLNLLIDKKLVTTAHLAQKAKRGIYQGVNALWLMAKFGYLDLIARVNESCLITTEMLSASPTNQKNIDFGKNVLWGIACQEQYELLKVFLARNDLTLSLLSSRSYQGPGQGANVLWHLASCCYFDLVASLMERKLITASMLASIDAQDNVVNVFWVLALHKQYALLKQCIEQDLVTPSMLASRAAHKDWEGVSAFWLLAKNGYFDLINTLTKKALVNLEMFKPAPLGSAVCQRENVVWFLAYGAQRDLLRFFMGRNYIDYELLTQKSEKGRWQGANALWFLAFYDDVDLMVKFANKYQLTPEALSASPTNRKNSFYRANVLWMLAINNQYSFIKSCIEYDFVTPSLLSTVVEGNCNFKGSNVLWILALYGYCDLIEQLMEKKRINAKMLFAFAQNEFQKDRDVVGLLAKARQYQLLMRLIENQHHLIRDMLDQEQVMASFRFLLNHFLMNKKFDLIKCLLNDGLLTENILNGLESSEEDKKSNVTNILLRSLLRNKQGSLIKSMWEKQLFRTTKIMSFFGNKTKGLFLILVLYAPGSQSTTLLVKDKGIKQALEKESKQAFVQDVYGAFSEMVRREPLIVVREAWRNADLKKVLSEAPIEMQNTLLRYLLGLEPTAQFRNAHFLSISNFIQNYLAIVKTGSLLQDLLDQLETQPLKENKILNNQQGNKDILIRLLRERTSRLHTQKVYHKAPKKKLHTEKDRMQKRDLSSQSIENKDISKPPLFYSMLPFVFSSKREGKNQIYQEESDMKANACQRPFANDLKPS